MEPEEHFNSFMKFQEPKVSCAVALTNAVAALFPKVPQTQHALFTAGTVPIRWTTLAQLLQSDTHTQKHTKLSLFHVQFVHPQQIRPTKGSNVVKLKKQNTHNKNQTVLHTASIQVRTNPLNTHTVINNHFSHEQNVCWLTSLGI